MGNSLFEDPPECPQDALARVPGTESRSGPGTVVYRRWAASDIEHCLLLSRPYSGGLEATAGLLHGAVLTADRGEFVAILASPTDTIRPWRRPVSIPTGEHSKIYPWSRVVALEARRVSFGDVDLARVEFLRHYAVKLASSRSKQNNQQAIRRHWTAAVEWLKVGRAGAMAALASAQDSLQSSGPESIEADQLATTLDRLSSLRTLPQHDRSSDA